MNFGHYLWPETLGLVVRVARQGHGARHSGQNFCNVTDHGQELVPPFVRQVRILGPEPRPREDFRYLFKCLFARDEPDPARIRKLQSRECWPRGLRAAWR